MKSLLLSVILIVSTISFAGCATTGKDGPVYNEQTLFEASIVLKSAARGAAIIAIEDSEDTRKTLQTVVGVLDAFLLADDQSPKSLSQKLSPTIRDIEKVEIQIAVTTVLDLYEIFYGRYVSSVFQDRTQNVYLLVKALRDGAAEALGSPAVSERE